METVAAVPAGRPDAASPMSRTGRRRCRQRFASLNTRIEEQQKTLDAMKSRFTEKASGRDRRQAPSLDDLQKQYDELEKKARRQGRSRRQDGPRARKSSKNTIPNPLFEQVKLRLVDIEATIGTLERRVRERRRRPSRNSRRWRPWRRTVGSGAVDAQPRLWRAAQELRRADHPARGRPSSPTRSRRTGEKIQFPKSSTRPQIPKHAERPAPPHLHVCRADRLAWRPAPSSPS